MRDRLFEKWTGIEWIPILPNRILKLDVYRVWESDGQPVSNGSIFLALEDAKITLGEGLIYIESNQIDLETANAQGIDYESPPSPDVNKAFEQDPSDTGFVKGSGSDSGDRE